MTSKTGVSTLWVAAAVALMAVGQFGCRACGSCYDYSSPVAGAAYGDCGSCRAGSCNCAPAETVGVMTATPIPQGVVLEPQPQPAPVETAY